jgi:CRISPR-associated protein Cas2
MIHCIVVYDIVDDKSRRIVGEVLEGYGTRVNRSVFECIFKSQKTFAKVRKGLEREIDPDTDSLRFYVVCTSCRQKAKVSADEPLPFAREAVYFF